MKVLKKLFLFSFVFFFISAVSFAKEIGSLDGVVINTYTDYVTPELAKYTRSNYIMNLKPTPEKIIVKHRMIDRNSQDVSDWRWTKGGERESLPNRAEPNYKYRLRMVRSGVVPGTETIFGSWSPDE